MFLFEGVIFSVAILLVGIIIWLCIESDDDDDWWDDNDKLGMA